MGGKTVNLQFALFCEEARDGASGKLDVQGILHELSAPGFPAMQERMVLVLVIEWDRKDQGRYNLKSELVSPGGQVVLTVDGHSEVDARTRDRPPARTQLVMPLEKVVFPEPGRYFLRIVAKGQRFKGPSLHLVRIEEAREEPLPEPRGAEKGISGDSGSAPPDPGRG